MVKSKAAWGADFREAVQFGYHSELQHMPLLLNIVETSAAIDVASSLSRGIVRVYSNLMAKNINYNAIF